MLPCTRDIPIVAFGRRECDQYPVAMPRGHIVQLCEQTAPSIVTAGYTFGAPNNGDRVIGDDVISGDAIVDDVIGDEVFR